MATAYIALGSNIQDPLQQVQLAIKTISQLPNTNLISVSPFYRSTPLGSNAQPDYLNAVIKIGTEFLPNILLHELQKIELRQGRKREKQRFAARTLDLDILLYDNLVLRSDYLTIPHYDIKNREFMLYPLYDIEPALFFPDGESLVGLLEKVPLNGMTYWMD